MKLRLSRDILTLTMCPHHSQLPVIQCSSSDQNTTVKMPLRFLQFSNGLIDYCSPIGTDPFWLFSFEQSFSRTVEKNPTCQGCALSFRDEGTKEKVLGILILDTPRKAIQMWRRIMLQAARFGQPHSLLIPSCQCND